MPKKNNVNRKNELMILREKYKQQMVFRGQHTTQEVIGMLRTASVTAGGFWTGIKLLGMLTGKSKKAEKSTPKEVDIIRESRNTIIGDLAKVLFGALFKEIKPIIMSTLQDFLKDLFKEKISQINSNRKND